jgi:anti-anti-sigma regulatory factor
MSITTPGLRLHCDRGSSGLVRIAVSGDVEHDTVGELHRALDWAATDRPTRVEMDLAAVDFMSPSPMRFLLQAAGTLPELRITAASISVRRCAAALPSNTLTD